MVGKGSKTTIAKSFKFDVGVFATVDVRWPLSFLAVEHL